jgi:hypothetical protein
MWILARFIIAIGAFLYRLCVGMTPKRFDEEFDGLRYLVKEKKYKGSVTKRTIEAPVRSAFLCALSPEKSWDRFWISLGFGEELQTGDRGFDNHIYVIGDHPLVGEYLKGDAKLRKLLQNLIGFRVRSIVITGKTVRFELPESVQVSKMLPSVAQVAESVRHVQSSVRSRFADSFYVKALFAEAFVWSVIAYSAASCIEWYVDHTTSHLHPVNLIPFGLALSLLLTLAGIALLSCFLGSSSRTPRIIGESALMLAFSFPFIGIQLIADANRTFDASQGWVAHPIIDRKYETKHRRGRAWYYRYHLEFARSSTNVDNLPFELPKEIEVEKRVYDSVAVNGHIELQIGAGFFHFPWLRNLRASGW